MAKHCADEHCGSFAPKDSDWCRKHGIEQLPDPEALEAAIRRGVFVNLDDAAESGKQAGEQFVSGFTDTLGGQAVKEWLGLEQSAFTGAAAIRTVQSAAAAAKRGRRKHRAPKTVRRSWRRLFRKATP